MKILIKLLLNANKFVVHMGLIVYVTFNLFQKQLNAWNGSEL